MPLELSDDAPGFDVPDDDRLVFRGRDEPSATVHHSAVDALRVAPERPQGRTRSNVPEDQRPVARGGHDLIVARNPSDAGDALGMSSKHTFELKAARNVIRLIRVDVAVHGSRVPSEGESLPTKRR